MAGYLAMFLFVVLIILAWLYAVQAKMLTTDCTFGKVQTTEGQDMSATLIGTLPENKQVIHSCVVKTDGLNHEKHFFQVKAKRNQESKGSLHVSAYGTDESKLLGHLDVSDSEDDWSSLTLCPSRYNNKIQDKYLSFSGTPNLAFTVQIDSSPLEIKLNEAKTVEVSAKIVQVFQFIPKEDISDTQLDVTVTSESADVPAYLKVSRDCKDVKDNIDDVDYKGESLRLSFAKKGRITLSKVSIPPLTDSNSSWFIGIGIKNATGNTPIDATKNVTLELSKSFDYSYALPIGLLVGLSIVIGGLIASFAILCFQKKNEETTTAEDNKRQDDAEQGHQSSSERTGTNKSSDNELPEMQPISSGADKSDPTNEHSEDSKTQQTSNPSGRDANINENTPLLPRDEPTSESTDNVTRADEGEQASTSTGTNKQQTRLDAFLHWVTRFLHWVTRGPKRCPKTYSHTTAITGFVLMVGAGQFVFANWHLMIQEGDRDNCYYNDFCYRVSDWLDIPLNLMISNLVYMIHGLILAISVCCIDSRHPLQEHTLSIGYAFSWALMFEGGFSLVYHLCPSKLTFQFDTAFMFVIAGLTVIVLDNGIEKESDNGIEKESDNGSEKESDNGSEKESDNGSEKESDNGSEKESDNGSEKESDNGSEKETPPPVRAGNFFLYILVPLFIFNYFGTLRHSETRIPLWLNIIFFFVLFFWWLLICIWAGWKLGVHDETCTRCTCCECCKCCKCCWNWKLFWFALGVAAPVGCFIYSIIKNNLPQGFLFACIAESVIVSFGTCFCRSLCKPENTDCPQCKESIKNLWKCRSLLKIFYVVVMGVVWVSALYYFLGKQTTDKVETPETSRNRNRECEMLGFFDSHDIWHFLSSHGLLMMVYLVMFMSEGDNGKKGNQPADGGSPTNAENAENVANA